MQYSNNRNHSLNNDYRILFILLVYFIENTDKQWYMWWKNFGRLAEDSLQPPVPGQAFKFRLKQLNKHLDTTDSR